jgi:hypothetical protein
MTESKDTAERVFNLFNQGQALSMAAGIAELLAFTNASECPGEAAQQAGYAISILLQADEIQREAECEALQAAIEAKREAEEIQRRRQLAFFDPDLDADARAELEASLTDEDLAGIERQIERGHKTWRLMMNKDDAALKRLEVLKASRDSKAEARS